MKSFIVKNQTFNKPGRAINLDDGSYDQVVIDSCTFTHTAGIFIQCKQNMSISITNCTFNEIIRVKGMEYAQAIQISGCGPDDTLHSVPISLLIQGNSVTNTKGVCDCEDVFNLIMCAGTLQHPLLIQGNTIHGAYPGDVSAKSLASYSGGGIIADRGAQYCVIQRNNVFETCNYGLAIAGGIGNVIRANTVQEKNGMGSGNVGIYSANMYPKDPFKNNVVTASNVIDWRQANGKANDLWIQ